jgi:PAS domain S-box-containing protein
MANMPARERSDHHAVPHRLSDEVVRTVVNRSPDGLMITQLDGTIVFANRALGELFATNADSLLGRSVEVLLDPDLRTPHETHRADYEHQPTVRPMGQGRQLSARRLDGTMFFVEVSLSPVVTDGETLTIATVRDVSGRLAAEEQLRHVDEALYVAEERERIARDLHDTVLQRLFGLGLELQALGLRTEPVLTERVERAVDELDRIIRDIRTTVFTLGAAQRQGSLGQELAMVTNQAARALGFTPQLRLDGPIESTVSDEIRPELMATLREAIGNVARHADSRSVAIEVRSDDHITLTVRDDGVGLGDQPRAGGGHGLVNLRARAERLGGHCQVANHPDGGVLLTWRVPRGT